MNNLIIKISLLLLLNYGCKANDNQYSSIFDQVIQHIEDYYFNYKVNDNHYVSLVHEYKDSISKCENENEFISIVNSFLFTLNASHTGFGKVSEIRQKVSPYIWYEYTAGIDVRIISNKVIITAVNDGNNIDPQIKMGDIIAEINSKSIKEILSNTVLRPPNNQRNHNFLKTEEILRKIYGFENSNLYLTTINSANRTNKIILDREKRKNSTFLFEGLPNVYLDVESRIYFESIGYIKFNAFQPSNPIDVINKIEEFKVLPSLIIDLRGNNGGSVEATRRIAAELLKNSNIYHNLYGQNDTTRITYSISNNPYKGKLIILVDELTISAAEIISDILQYTKSAKIVGLQTPGNVLSGELFTISDNYSLLLPIEDWVRNDGFRLEGNGVKPDFLVELKEAELIKGIDGQLEFAINYLK